MPSPTTITSRRSLDLRSYDDLVAAIGVLRTGCSKTGEWSLEQIVYHLNTTMTVAMDGRKGLPRPVRWLLRPICRRMVRARSMPRIPSPKSLRPPSMVGDGVFSQFEHIVSQCRALTGESIDHPAFGRIPLDEWHQLQLIHASRHLSFLSPAPLAVVAPAI